jgi:hypothetical protein
VQARRFAGLFYRVWLVPIAVLQVVLWREAPTTAKL